jgi:uncharacterized repeat protein (TIGR02543 family)
MEGVYKMFQKTISRRFVSVLVIAILAVGVMFVVPPVADGGSYASTADGMKVVTYDPGNGQDPVSVNYSDTDTALQLPPAPVRSGWTFKGWFDASSYGGNEVHAGDVVDRTNLDEPYTVYAQWTKTLKAIYAPGKGKLKSGASKSKSVKYGATYGTLATAARTGYRLLGWFIGSERVFSTTVVTKASDHKVTAKWLKKGKGATVTKAEVKILSNNINYYLSLADVRAVIGGKGKYVGLDTYNGYDVKVYTFSGQKKGTYINCYFSGKYMLAYKGYL